jgi:putative transposase
VTTVSRSGYYKWKKEKDHRIRDIRDEEMYQLIAEIFAESRGTYGKKRIKAALKKNDMG